jgi:ribulose-phosphate 3-epimerase
MLIAPSVLSADFANLQRDIEMLNQSEADWIHIDIMDGVFVPNISFGIPVCKAIAKHAEKLTDVHLMIVNPEKYVDDFVKAGAKQISVHAEACVHLHSVINKIKESGTKAGVALNPHTPIQVLENIIENLDLVILMSVNPGFGGQKFIENSLRKTEDLKNLILKYNANCLIEIDGGVNLEIGKMLKKSGADVLVAGSFVFESQNPLQTIKDLKEI